MQLKILLIGKYFSNYSHGAEVGIVHALDSLNGEKTSIVDYHAKRFFDDGYYGSEFFDAALKYICKNTYDLILAVGPGIPPDMAKLPHVKQLLENNLSICWNSEPIRLPNYRAKFLEQRDLFHYWATFSEDEVALYLNDGAKNSFFLPQAFNPEWYKPLGLDKNKLFCFVGSIGGKWNNRVPFLNRVRNICPDATIKQTFNAQEVNQIYNHHRVGLNLGLYHKGLGPPEHLTSYGLQQRIFEYLGTGIIPLTNKPANLDSTPQTAAMFTNMENILYYENSSLEAMLRFCMESPEKLDILGKNVLKIREKHTYKARMKQLLNILEVRYD